MYNIVKLYKVILNSVIMYEFKSSLKNESKRYIGGSGDGPGKTVSP